MASTYEPAGQSYYRFGNVVVDAAAHTLQVGGEPVSVEPKAYSVLLCLLEHAGELLDKDVLLDTVWGHHHVTPGVLTRAIAQLRAAIGDDPHAPRYIQTQHGVGYRFIAKLEERPERRRIAREETPVPAALPVADAAPVADAEAVQAPVNVIAARTGGRRQWRWLALSGLVLVLAVFGVWRMTAQAPVRPAEASIAVLPFSTLSDDRSDAYFAEGLAVELHDALAGVPGLKVAACPTDSACGTRGADVRRIGKLLGVASVLDADVRREGQRVRINARLADTRTGFTVWSGSYERELKGVFALQQDIASEVVQSLPGLQAYGADAFASRLAPTMDVAAYDAYLKGMQQLRGRGDVVGAIRFFNEAIAADAGFARAQAGICRGEIIRFETTRDAAAYDRAEHACKRASTMDPALREVSLALGDLHMARSEPARALEFYKQAVEDQSLKADAYLGMARAEAAQKRNDVALDYFERARQLRPGDAAIYRSMGFHHYVNGNLAKAVTTYRVATELEPNDEETWASYGGLCMLNGETSCASDAYMRSLAIKPSYGALMNLGTLRYDSGIYDEAATLYRRATTLDASDYRAWGNLGDALSARTSTAEQAREPYMQAARMAQGYIDLKPQDAHAIAVLAWYRANLGQAPASRELIERAQAIGAEKGEVAYFAAQAYAVLGDVDRARAHVETALSEGIRLQRLEASPVLRELMPTLPTFAQAEAQIPHGSQSGDDR